MIGLKKNLTNIAQHWKQHYQVDIIQQEQNVNEDFFYSCFYKKEKTFLIVFGLTEKALKALMAPADLRLI